ncbi:MAG: DNA translocase FtsK 4TM domain-containing protein [Brevundimonas sp.]|uniref:FtsK/SpoIIIE family DNA translocase n=1 Tax=Brevundimonas sp. TaxID=1871086 RepID=UPI00391884D2
MSAAMAISQRTFEGVRILWNMPLVARFRGCVVAIAGVMGLAALLSWNPLDPSWNAASADAATNWLGGSGAVAADLFMQSLGLAAWPALLLVSAFGIAAAIDHGQPRWLRLGRWRGWTALGGILALSGALSSLADPAAWPLSAGLGGLWGDGLHALIAGLIGFARIPGAGIIAGLLLAAGALAGLAHALGLKGDDVRALRHIGRASARSRPAAPVRKGSRVRVRQARVTEPASPAAPRAQGAPSLMPEPTRDLAREPSPAPDSEPRVRESRAAKPSRRAETEGQGVFEFAREDRGGFSLPALGILARPKGRSASVDEQALKQNARMLESVLAEFGVRGVIDQIRPGPVVTLYELAPAPGVKHARVVALSDDIARSMSARACRVSVVQGRNAIGIELPNARRETVYLRDLLASSEYDKPAHLLPLALGETIGGEPYVADLARMPHLLIAGTTGSGKSVGVNAMILSILYRLTPAECRFIMIDPKMLELSVYDGIPHLLSPVVTDPKKAVVALKWTVREMEDRYRRMSKLGVRNIASYNQRAREALEKGEHFERTVQTGFDDQGRPVYESEKIRPEPMPYLVVVMDEMADLMLVAGKDVEGAVQRLAQMARAAGIHLIMATQRPSVDVITGTIKANFPTRISFQVTSKIDSRTILGEQGGEQLLGQGDMLYMAGGGRITRLHGPFVSDAEVEAVAQHLRLQGAPDYLDEVTSGDDEDGGSDPFGGGGEGGSGDDLYDRAVAIVTRDRKASTSYIQRRLQIGYNRAASLMERMENEGVVSPANHAGKRDVLAGPPPAA